MKVQQNTNISVYLTIGRHAKKLEEGRLQVMLSAGVEKPLKLSQKADTEPPKLFNKSDLQNTEKNFVLKGGA